MPRELGLGGRREDADLRVPAGLGRIHEHRLGEPRLEREPLEHLLGDLARIGEDGELVPFERRVREHVRDDVAEGRHAVSKYDAAGADRSRRLRRASPRRLRGPGRARGDGARRRPALRRRPVRLLRAVSPLARRRAEGDAVRPRPHARCRSRRRTRGAAPPGARPRRGRDRHVAARARGLPPPRRQAHRDALARRPGRARRLRHGADPPQQPRPGRKRRARPHHLASPAGEHDRVAPASSPTASIPRAIRTRRTAGASASASRISRHHGFAT